MTIVHVHIILLQEYPLMIRWNRHCHQYEYDSLIIISKNDQDILIIIMGQSIVLT